MSANGRLAGNELTTIAGMQLAHMAAQAFRNWSEACRVATGYPLTIIRPAGAYRSYAVQRDMRLNPGDWNLNPKSSINLAREGSSTHGTGTRVDIGYYAAASFGWALANAARFGFSREFGAADPNHFAHNGRTTGPTYTIAPGGGITRPLEDEMSAAGEAAILGALQGVRSTLANIENILAVDTFPIGPDSGGIRGAIVGARDTMANLERILAVDTVDGIPGGIRGRLNGVAATGSNIERILAVETVNGVRGGIRGTSAEALKAIKAVAAAK